MRPCVCVCAWVVRGSGRRGEAGRSRFERGGGGGGEPAGKPDALFVELHSAFY